jgi:hypothetical protein
MNGWLHHRKRRARLDERPILYARLRARWDKMAASARVDPYALHHLLHWRTSAQLAIRLLAERLRYANEQIACYEKSCEMLRQGREDARTALRELTRIVAEDRGESYTEAQEHLARRWAHEPKGPRS